MANRKVQFYGLVFFTGMELLPDDIVVSLAEIRKWAFNKSLVTDPEFQFLLNDRVEALSGHFSPEDQLQIAVAIHPGDGKPFYFEYPYLPVKSLIRRGEEVELLYWQMRPTRWDATGNILDYSEAKFGFLLPGCSEEICSMSTAKRVVEKLHSFLLDLSSEYKVQYFTLEEGAVLLEPDVREYFPDSEAMNKALRGLIALIPEKRRVVETKAE